VPGAMVMQTRRCIACNLTCRRYTGKVHFIGRTFIFVSPISCYGVLQRRAFGILRLDLSGELEIDPLQAGVGSTLRKPGERF